jgi:hypothetical protein
LDTKNTEKNIKIKNSVPSSCMFETPGTLLVSPPWLQCDRSCRVADRSSSKIKRRKMKEVKGKKSTMNHQMQMQARMIGSDRRSAIDTVILVCLQLQL